jgi:hypothetical protein
MEASNEGGSSSALLLLKVDPLATSVLTSSRRREELTSLILTMSGQFLRINPFPDLLMRKSAQRE